MKEAKTHAQIFLKDKVKLEKLRDKNGLASIAVVVNRLLKGLL